MSTCRDGGSLLPPIDDRGTAPPPPSLNRRSVIAKDMLSVNDDGSQVSDLLVQLQLEERILNAAKSMISGFENDTHAPTTAEWQERRKLQQQAEASASAIRDLKAALRMSNYNLDDVDIDDEVSSGDEEGHTVVVADGAAIDDDAVPCLSSPLDFISRSANSSVVDLSDTLDSKFSGSSITDSGSPKALTAQRAGRIARAIDAIFASTQLTECEVAIAGVEEVIAESGTELASILSWDRVLECIRFLLLKPNPVNFSLGLRLARDFIFSSKCIPILSHGLQLDLILITVLGQDGQEVHNSRYYAMQIVRQVMVLSAHADISKGVSCAIVAIAEQPDDSLRELCVETLAELMVLSPERTLEAGSVHVLLEAMSSTKKREEAPAYALALCMALVATADTPSLRIRFLRNGADFSSVLTAFTDVQLYNFHNNAPQSLQTCAAVMKLLLRTWVGLHCFDVELMIDCLTIPVADVQKTLLDVVDSSLWLATEPLLPKDVSAYYSALVTNQFTAVLLNKYINARLFDQLELLQTSGESLEVQTRARELMARLFVLTAKLVPQPQLLALHSRATTGLKMSLANSRAYSLPTAASAFLNSEALLSQEVRAPRFGTFARFGMDLDDLSFKRLVASTHVLDTKVFAQWNWDALMELVEGPLRSSKRMDEVTRGSKFMKRLLSFFRPFKYRFSYLTATQENRRYAELGKALMSTFLATDDGVRYLSSNKLFRQIAECLAQLDPLSGIVSADPLLSVKRFRLTLCSAYVEMIGVLSREAVGQQVLAQMRIFNMYYRACDIDREDIVRSIVCSLDYKLPGHPRLILAKALSSTSTSTRIYASEYVGYRLACSEPQLWLVELLVEQLYDPEFAIAKTAAKSLYNLCAACVPNLDFLISLKPSFKHLREHKESLITLLMTRSKGFALAVAELDLSNWTLSFQEGYVDKIEAYLENLEISRCTTLQESGKGRAKIEPFTFPYYSRPPRHSWKSSSNPPSHLYGELASTEEGCALLKSKGNLTELCDTIHAAGYECKSNPTKDWKKEDLKRIKGALWAIGHIGSRTKGTELLDVSVVESMCKIARYSLTYSFRGTACYALAFFGNSQSGAEFLHQCSWTVVYDNYQMPQGVALPPKSYENVYPKPPSGVRSMEFPLVMPESSDVDSLKKYNTAEAFSAYTSSASHLNRRRSSETGVYGQSRQKALLTSTPDLKPFNWHDEVGETSEVSEVNEVSEVGEASETSHAHAGILRAKDAEKERLLSAVSELTSSMLSQAASKKLVALRSSNPALFQNEEVLNEVLSIFSCGHYKQAIRRFVFKLFDRNYILEKIYKRRR